jgi:tetratricopeptide (TPR) repeat protein
VPIGSRSRRKTAAVSLLVLAVAVGALRRGGVEPLVAAAVALAALVALALAWPRGERATFPGATPVPVTPPGVPLLALGLSGGALLVALQLLPLPPALLRLLSPNAAVLFEETLAPVARWPAWRPLSLQPGETAFLLVAAVAVAAGAAAAAFLGDRRDRGEKLLRAIAWTGLAVSLVGMGTALLGFGPLLVSRATFINPNHLAGFLQLAAWPAFGFALRARGKERVGWLAVFAFTVVGIFLSLSRGGITAFFVAAAVSSVLAVLHGHTPLTIALLGRERRHHGRALTHGTDAAAAPSPGLPPAGAGERGDRPGVRGILRSLALPVGVACALAIAAWLALEPVLAEMETLSGAASEVKPALWPDGLRLIRQFPVTGIGRGAFETVYPSLKTEPAQVTFTHLENTWLQLPVDVGVVPGLALLALFGWAWLAAARSRDLSRPMIGALAGAAGVAAHNLVDFSFELVGVALPFAIVLGLASRAMPRVRLPRAWAMGGVALLAALGGAGLAIRQRQAGDDVAERISRAGTIPETTALASQALAWRPADWLPQAAAGVRIVAAGRCSEGLPWLVRAMTRNPTAPEPHRYAARCLAAGGKGALAKREYRLAFLYGDRDALAEALRRFQEPGELLDVAPETVDGLIAAATLLAQRPEEAKEAWTRAWEQFLDPRALAGLARVNLQLDDDAEALKLARELERIAPENPQGWLVAAQALEKQGDSGAGIAELEKGAAHLAGKGAILVPLGVRHLAAKRPSQARAVFEQIVAREGPELANKKLFIARTYSEQGRIGEALATAQDAAATDRESVYALEVVSRYAADVGRFDLAIDALERAARLPKAKPGAYDDLIAKLKSANVEKQLRQR